MAVDTSSLKFEVPFIDPKSGVLARWAYHYLLNPSVSNINLASGGSINAAGATINAHAVNLGIPLRPASGGTGQSAPGAAAANAIGALAEASNLSDLTNAGTARTNLGLGTLATLSMVSLTTNVTGVLPVANGGTNASVAGATAAANIGALAVANNLSDVVAATARTNLGLGSMATQAATAVAITGGAVDGTVIGGVTEAAASFTGVTLNSGTQLTAYVEGTFTPTLVSTGGGAPTYGVQIGEYTNIGNRVLFNMRLTISALNTLAAGTLTIAGLPIASNATANNFHAVMIAANNLAVTAVTEVTGQIVAGSTSITMSRYAAGTATGLTQGDITGTAIFSIAGHYQI